MKCFSNYNSPFNPFCQALPVKNMTTGGRHHIVITEQSVCTNGTQNSAHVHFDSFFFCLLCTYTDNMYLYEADKCEETCFGYFKN